MALDPTFAHLLHDERGHGQSLQGAIVTVVVVLNRGAIAMVKTADRRAGGADGGGGRGVPLPHARGGEGGCRRGRWGETCARCTRDSDQKIQYRWRLRILKTNKYVYVWFGSKVGSYLIQLTIRWFTKPTQPCLKQSECMGFQRTAETSTCSPMSSPKRVWRGPTPRVGRAVRRTSGRHTPPCPIQDTQRPHQR